MKGFKMIDVIWLILFTVVGLIIVPYLWAHVNGGAVWVDLDGDGVEEWVYQGPNYPYNQSLIHRNPLTWWTIREWGVMLFLTAIVGSLFILVLNREKKELYLNEA